MTIRFLAVLMFATAQVVSTALPVSAQVFVSDPVLDNAAICGPARTSCQWLQYLREGQRISRELSDFKRFGSGSWMTIQSDIARLSQAALSMDPRTAPAEVRRVLAIQLDNDAALLSVLQQRANAASGTNQAIQVQSELTGQLAATMLKIHRYQILKDEADEAALRALSAPYTHR